MGSNEKILVRPMNNETFRNIAVSHLMQAAYPQLKGSETLAGSHRLTVLTKLHFL